MTESSERADRSGDGRFEKLGEETSTTVTHAASVLEAELAAGIAHAQRLGEGLSADRRVDPEAFDELLGRVGKDGHALIDTVAAQLPRSEVEERNDLARRYTADAHDVFDALLTLARLAPDLANGLADRIAEPSGRPDPGRDA